MVCRVYRQRRSTYMYIDVRSISVRKKALRTCTLGIVGHCLDFGVPLPCLVPLFRKEEGRVRWSSAGRGPEGRARGVAQGYQRACFRTW